VAFVFLAFRTRILFSPKDRFKLNAVVLFSVAHRRCSLKNLTMELNSHLTEDGALLVGNDIKLSGDEAHGGDAEGARAGNDRGSPGAGADSKGTDAKDGADGGEGASGPSTGIAGECACVYS
jgi:hypothetical protein